MTQKEFDAGNDGLHIPLTCENHPDLRWSCKKVALTLDDSGKLRYNGRRNVFFAGPLGERECSCPIEKLYAVLEG